MSVDHEENETVPRCPKCNGRMVMVETPAGDPAWYHVSHGMTECLTGKVT